MEERCYYPIQQLHHSSAPPTPHNFSSTVISNGISMRTTPPADYILKIGGFSNLSQRVEEYESNIFEAGGYKWRLALYPNGDTKRNINADGYISLYLVLVETSELPDGWEVGVDFKLFIYNQIRDEYIFYCSRYVYAKGELTRFNKMHTEDGFPLLISQDVFDNPSNGYLVGDSCSFGAEIFVVSKNNTMKVEYLSTFHYFDPDRNDNDSDGLYTWKVINFSNTSTGYIVHKSDVFSAARKNWMLEVFCKEKHLALRLHLIRKESYFAKYLSFLRSFRKCNNENIAEEGDLWVECKFRVQDQIHGNHREEKVHRWFHVNSNLLVLEIEDYMPLVDLSDKSKGFLLNDALIIDVEFDRIRQLKTL